MLVTAHEAQPLKSLLFRSVNALAHRLIVETRLYLVTEFYDEAQIAR